MHPVQRIVLHGSCICMACVLNPSHTYIERPAVLYQAKYRVEESAGAASDALNNRYYAGGGGIGSSSVKSMHKRSYSQTKMAEASYEKVCQSMWRAVIFPNLNNN